MKCPKCEGENPEGAKFCIECGTSLSRICSKCESENPSHAKFCAGCGNPLLLHVKPTPKELTFDEKLQKIQKYLPGGLTEKILSQRGKIEGERKQVTVLFADMENFTPLVEKLGPEEAYAIMDQVYEILIHKVHDFEGTVNEMTGDGVMALFGAPIALEDAPQRAIRSALAIHQEIARFSDRMKQEKGIPQIKMRIGIHTGPWSWEHWAMICGWSSRQWGIQSTSPPGFRTLPHQEPHIFQMIPLNLPKDSSVLNH